MFGCSKMRYVVTGTADKKGPLFPNYKKTFPALLLALGDEVAHGRKSKGGNLVKLKHGKGLCRRKALDFKREAI
jgi:hypothetical protein